MKRPKHQKRKTPGQLHHEMGALFKARHCLHPDAGPATCDGIIAAHTIQREGPIARMCNEKNHVGSFHTRHRNFSGELRPEPVGWRNASTFSGFCARHDNLVFAPLEKHPFEGTREQCFLASYRALCHEFYSKRCVERFAHQLVEDVAANPEAFVPSADEIAHVFSGSQSAGLRDAGLHKGAADDVLKTGDFGSWDARILWFEGATEVAATGCFFPDFDLEGEMLQDLYDLAMTPEPVVISCHATPKGGAVCFGFHRGAVAPTRFLESLERRPGDRIASAVVTILFCYLENTYFSLPWWDRLRPQQQDRIQRLAPYQFEGPVPLNASRIVSWENVSFTSPVAP